MTQEINQLRSYPIGSTEEQLPEYLLNKERATDKRDPYFRPKPLDTKGREVQIEQVTMAQEPNDIRSYPTDISKEQLPTYVLNPKPLKPKEPYFGLKPLDTKERDVQAEQNSTSFM